MKKKIEEKGIFADPTYDITFKMLFGNDKNKDVLISFLNNLLDFEGEKEIKDVSIISNELLVEDFSKDKGKSGIKSAVDVLCTTTGGQEIAIEMQHKQKDYFLTRTQEYMSKLIAGQVKEGQGELYHEAVMDTYILVIGKENMFRGKFALKEVNLFEVDIVPTVKQTGEEMPGNKMHWKFFELLKFEKSYKNVVIDKNHSLKEQWLDFFIKCSTKSEIPDNINDIIKKGYDIMKLANLTHEQKNLYWKEKQGELDTLEQIEIEKKEASEQAFKEGEFKGKLKGEVKGEISKVKNFMELEIPQEKYINKLKFLNQEKMKDSFDYNINYIKEHFDDTESMICNDLDLMGKMDIEYQEHPEG